MPFLHWYSNFHRWITAITVTIEGLREGFLVFSGLAAVLFSFTGSSSARLSACNLNLWWSHIYIAGFFGIQLIMWKRRNTLLSSAILFFFLQLSLYLSINSSISAFFCLFVFVPFLRINDARFQKMSSYFLLFEVFYLFSFFLFFISCKYTPDWKYALFSLLFCFFFVFTSVRFF